MCVWGGGGVCGTALLKQTPAWVGGGVGGCAAPCCCVALSSCLLPGGTVCCHARTTTQTPHTRPDLQVPTCHQPTTPTIPAACYVRRHPHSRKSTPPNDFLSSAAAPTHLLPSTNTSRHMCIHTGQQHTHTCVFHPTAPCVVICFRCLTLPVYTHSPAVYVLPQLQPAEVCAAVC